MTQSIKFILFEMFRNNSKYAKIDIQIYVANICARKILSTDPIFPYVLQYYNAILKLLEKLYSEIELMKYLVYDALN